MRLSNVLKYALVIPFLSLCLLVVWTLGGMRPVVADFNRARAQSESQRLLARDGEPLSATYLTRWNASDLIALHEIPPFLRESFLLAEDKRFYTHRGIDWRARLSALFSNLRHGRTVRGASTISEQVVRMLHPGPRSLRARWLEGFEAMLLERHVSKADILEFYLNQVPYAANRRGIVQAAEYYFDRTPDTLSPKEMLALAVLVRAPSRLDLFHDAHAADGAIARLAARLPEAMRPDRTLLDAPLAPRRNAYEIPAEHFIAFVRRQPIPEMAGQVLVKTTLDAPLQARLQAMMEKRLAGLGERQVENGAILVADHHSGEVLAWVVAGNAGEKTPGRYFDAVTTPRQPGSAMKPFLYALALEKGWSPATVIEDAPLAEQVGSGMHRYRNYSQTFYGPVSVRQALGNSLNIPALKAFSYVGAGDYFSLLHQLGFSGLNAHPDRYGDGIALGNGEVTLYQLVEAYTALANRGVIRPLRVVRGQADSRESMRVFSPETASLIGHILSDSSARSLEFGASGILRFPGQAAVKTGTSSDYRDAWAVAYDDRYVAGIWMGNLSQKPTDGLTGSTGPALLLRGVFAELNRYRDTAPLYMSPKLVRRDICAPGEEKGCERVSEWFAPSNASPSREGDEDALSSPRNSSATLLNSGSSALREREENIRLRQPANHLLLAMDPRLPAASQAFEFVMDGVSKEDAVQWIIDGETLHTRGGRYLWPLSKGEHAVSAEVRRGGKRTHIREVSFRVK